jgi:glutaminyl-peptide cyclotransferase
MVKKITAFAFALGACAFLFSCNENKNKTNSTETKLVEAPSFNEDSALFFLETQVNFGPRVPSTKAHANCAKYLKSKLASYKFEVIEQNGPAKTFDGKSHTIKNIIGSWKPEIPYRILLTAHWDSRPFADKDPKNKNGAIDGANDGASGVAVILEIARILSKNDVNLGIDILFNDIEDYGKLDSLPDNGDGIKTWCIGTQYWANNPHKPNYQATYGILLDMVGASNAVFPREGVSTYFANDIVAKVWGIANKLGYSAYFVNAAVGQTVDDHTFINQIRQFPVIDIVHMDPVNGGYFPYHHTHGDNLSHIDKKTLKAVGQTVLTTLYN